MLYPPPPQHSVVGKAYYLSNFFSLRDYALLHKGLFFERPTIQCPSSEFRSEKETPLGMRGEYKQFKDPSPRVHFSYHRFYHHILKFFNTFEPKVSVDNENPSCFVLIYVLCLCSELESEISTFLKAKKTSRIPHDVSLCCP